MNEGKAMEISSANLCTSTFMQVEVTQSGKCSAIVPAEGRRFIRGGRWKLLLTLPKLPILQKCILEPSIFSGLKFFDPSEKPRIILETLPYPVKEFRNS